MLQTFKKVFLIFRKSKDSEFHEYFSAYEDLSSAVPCCKILNDFYEGDFYILEVSLFNVPIFCDCAKKIVPCDSDPSLNKPVE